MKSKPNLFQRVSKFIIVNSFAIIFIGASATVRAENWTGSLSTDWNLAGNWDTLNVPNGQNAIINTSPTNIATITATVPIPNDVIVGDGTGTNGRVDHLAGDLAMNFWFKPGHNGGTGVYNLGVPGGSGTYTNLSQGSGNITVGNNGQLRLGGDGGNNTGNGTLNVHTTGTITVTGGDIAVGKQGSGTLNIDSGTINRVNGTNSGGTFIIGDGSGVTGLMRMSGGTVNNTGEFWIGNGGGGNGTMTLSGGIVNQDTWLSLGRDGNPGGVTGTLNVSGGTLNKADNNSHVVVGDGSFGHPSTGTLNQTGGTINVASQFWIGKGNNSGSNVNGTATVSAGTLQVNRWLALGRDGATGTLTINGTGSVIQGSPGDPFSNLEVTNSAGTATVNLDGGTLTAMGIIKSGSGGTSIFNFNGGTLRAGRDNANFMQGLSQGRVLDAVSFIDTQNFNVTIEQGLFRAGTLGTGVLRKIGSGSLTLGGAGDNAGLRVRLDAGILVLGKASSGGVHAVGSSGIFDHALQITGGTAKLGGTGGDQIYSASPVNMTGGTLDLAGLSEGFDGLSGLTGSIITNSIAATTSTLTLGEDNSQGTPVFSGVIENGAGLTALAKVGGGTQILTGINTYTGPTNVNSGILLVNGSGSLAAGTTVTVAAGGTLGGTGTVNGPVSATTATSNIAPGSSGIGTLNIANNTVLNGVLKTDLNATLGDQLNVTGDLNVTGAVVQFNPLSTPTAVKYVIVKYSGNLTGTLSTSTLPSGYTLTHDGPNKEIHISKANAGFSAYMNNFTGLSEAEKLPDADPDNDGVRNLVEYALAGFDPTVSNPSPGTWADPFITFSKRPLAVSNNDITYAIEESATLGAAPDPWQVVAPAADNSNSIIYEMSVDEPKKFIRLKVSQK